MDAGGGVAMNPLQIAIVAAVFVAGVVLAALGFWLRERMNAGSRDRVLGYRDIYEPLFADLWSDVMHRRLTALFVAQRIAKSRSASRGLANVLVSFIRRRLSATQTADLDKGSFEDVRLALTILGTRALRRAQAESGQNIDLGGINFRGAALFGTDLKGFRLVQCNFDGCQMVSAKLVGADLSGASLIGTDLRRTDLRNVDFSEADLSDADLTMARVTGAQFANTNISGTIMADAVGLVQEQLDQAFGDTGTAVPERMRFVPGRSQRLRKPTAESGV
jgi:uncharacterized protein YjbI with pentapeptide repeats